jgi:outer membrane protein OmpA-like peptidoglycan-associated protein
MHRPFLLLALLPIAFCASAQVQDLAAVKFASSATAEGDRMVQREGQGPAGALTNFQAAHVPAPAKAEAVLERGLSALEGPFPATSLNWFKQAVAVDPQLKKGHYLLGCAYQLNAQWDAAIGEFKKHLAVLREGPDADPTWNRAEKHILECTYGKEFSAHAGHSFITSAGKVNTAADEFGPLPISGGALLFTRACAVGSQDSGRVHDAVFMSRWSAEGWTLGGPMTAEADNVGTACMNAVGMRPMIWREGAEGGGLMELGTTSNGRKRPVDVPADFANDPTAGRPYFTTDGQWFYFSSARPGGLGGSDLYRCRWDASRGGWSSAEDLGAPVNSEYDEDGAFLTADGSTLYFASEGHSSMGGYDLFSSTCTNGSWTAPKNLGWPVNSPGDDRDLVLAPDAGSGYFSSDRAGGSGRSDIYRVDLSPGVHADATAMLASAGPGVPTTDDEQHLRLVGFIKGLRMMEPVQARIQLMDLADTSYTATFTSDPVTGEFTADVPAGRSYAMHVTADGFLPHSDRIGSDSASGDVRMDMGLKTTDTGNSEVMRNIHFGGNSCTLEPSSMSDLDQLLEFLRSDPTIRIEIDGHTDSDVGPMPNQELSEERAKAVKDWLVRHGISPDRLLAKGFGASRPFVPNDSNAHMALNRRTEIKVL